MKPFLAALLEKIKNCVYIENENKNEPILRLKLKTGTSL